MTQEVFHKDNAASRDTEYTSGTWNQVCTPALSAARCSIWGTTFKIRFWDWIEKSRTASVERHHRLAS